MCEGYELRLSWPHKDNRKRAIVGLSPTKQSDATELGELKFINATFSDMEMQRFLADLAPSGKFFDSAMKHTNDTFLVTNQNEYPSQFTLAAPIQWIPWKLITKEVDLLQYCKLGDEKCG